MQAQFKFSMGVVCEFKFIGALYCSRECVLLLLKLIARDFSETYCTRDTNLPQIFIIYLCKTGIAFVHSS